MRTIISGPVTQQDVEDADLMAAIQPTVYRTNGQWTPPASQLPTEVDPPCPMLGDLAEHQRNMSMCAWSDALILRGENDDLLHSAQRMGLRVYHPG